MVRIGAAAWLAWLALFVFGAVATTYAAGAPPDSARMARLARNAYYAGLTVGVREQRSRARVPRPYVPEPPFTADVYWPDRPIDGPGLHVPRSAHVELEGEAYSHTRMATTERHDFWRFVPDGSDTLGHFEPASYVEREVRRRTRVGSQRWSIGVGGQAAIVLTADGFAREDWSSSLFGSTPSRDRYSPLNGLELRLRPFGTDTSAWAHAITFAGSVHDEVLAASTGAAVRFPLGPALRGRMSADIVAMAFPGASYALGAIGSHHDTPRLVDVTVAIERRVSRGVWWIAAYAWHGDRSSAYRIEEASFAAAGALGGRTALDAGLRFVTTPDAPSPTPFVGLSLR